VAYAEKKGCCPTSRAKDEHPLVQITNLECIICAQTMLDHNEMQAHLAQHSINPPQIYRVPQHRHGVGNPSRIEGQASQQPTTRRGTRPSGASRRGRARSTERRLHGVESERTTVAVAREYFEIARQVADRRARQGGSEQIRVDAIAANFASSSRFREYNLLHTFREVQSVGSVESKHPN
jgi:hypothetical protein